MNLVQKTLLLIPIVAAIALFASVFFIAKPGMLEKDLNLKTHTELCKLGTEPQHCDDLIKFGIDPDLYQHNKEYKSAIDKKADSKPLKKNKEFVQFTHYFAAENSITLQDSYTSRWPEP